MNQSGRMMPKHRDPRVQELIDRRRREDRDRCIITIVVAFACSVTLVAIGRYFYALWQVSALAAASLAAFLLALSLTAILFAGWRMRP